MARYIDADALKLDIDLSKGATVVDMALAVIKSVQEAPTADVAEVKHGEWQEERWCDNFQHTCSLCHKTVRVHPQSVTYKYCPYCGAIMDGRKEADK